MYELRNAAPGAVADYTPYGAAREFMVCHAPEAVIEGPSETGKTLAAMWKLHIACCKYEGAQIAIVRKVYNDLIGSVLQTYEKRVLGGVDDSGDTPDGVVHRFGGQRPEWYDYANGSRIWLGGMDVPGKVLSSERDIVYVNQLEQLTESDYETITTRTTGRAGNMPYSQTIGDCNPGNARHWIVKRALDHKLILFKSFHRDNPTLYDPVTGVITAQGERTIATLQALTGVRYKRLYLGEWTNVEGAVFDMFDATIHVKQRDLGKFTWWALAQDEGYRNPAVILLIGVDNDGNIHIAKEWYERGKLQEDVVKQALDWTVKFRPVVSAVDAAAAGLIAAERSAGIPAEPCKGRVMDRIAFIQNLLKVADNGLPGMTIDPDCVNVINEFESYRWQAGGMREQPVKEDDHAIDGIGYFTDWIQSGSTSEQVVYNPVRIGR